MANSPWSPMTPFGGSGRRDMRASDADRERVVEALRQHAGEGRLTVEELTDRVEHVYSAKTVGELDVVLHDLPQPARSGGTVPALHNFVQVRRRRRSLSFFALRLAIIDAALIVIWLFTGHHAGFEGFWPIWPLVMTAVWFAFRCVKAIERRRNPEPTIPFGGPVAKRAVREASRAARRAYRR